MTATWILAGLSGVCLILFVYPYAIYPQLLRLIRQKPIRKNPANLSASLLFCAHNEIECIGEKVENLGQLKRASPNLQILVYDDASTDGTYELLAAAPDIVTVIRGAGRTGKAAGMKALARRATGDVLIFTDANILLSTDLVERLLPYYGDPEVGGAAGTICAMTDPKSLTSQIGSTYAALDDKLQMLESGTGNVMGASGGLFSVRRSLYPEFPDTVQDDFVVSMNVIFQGKRLVKALDVVGYERTVSRRGEELRRKVRIGARAFHTHAFLRPGLKTMAARDRWKYSSRKMLRWFGGVFLMLGGLFALAAVATLSLIAAVVLVVAAFVAFAIGIRVNAGGLAKLAEAVLATFATLVGILKGMRGETMAVWTPAKSR
ncbi:MAG TPA: glycosyltransferase [Sphingomicrobium sp.]|nr:glycosyltransferase [Sphingomicrobium sp.]